MSQAPEPEVATRTVGVCNLADAIEPRPAAPSIPRLTLRLDDLAKALGISRRALERERSAGRFPRPDLTIGRMPLWRVETILGWVAKGGGHP